MKKILFSAAVCSLFMISCNNEKENLRLIYQNKNS